MLLQVRVEKSAIWSWREKSKKSPEGVDHSVGVLPTEGAAQAVVMGPAA